MDEVSVTRTDSPSTRAILADEAFCAQAAAVLMCDRGLICDAFIGEPAEEVLAMVRWALSHEDDEGFYAAKVLTDWARKRGRGAWSAKPPKASEAEQDRKRELARMLVEFWNRHPEDLAALLDWVQASLNGRSS